MHAGGAVDVHIQPLPRRHLVVGAAGVAVIPNGSGGEHQLRAFRAGASGKYVKITLHEALIEHTELTAYDVDLQNLTDMVFLAPVHNPGGQGSHHIHFVHGALSLQLLGRFNDGLGIILSLEVQIAALTIVPAEQVVDQAVQVRGLNADGLIRTQLLAAAAEQAGIRIVVDPAVLDRQGLGRALAHTGPALVAASAHRGVDLPAQAVGRVELPLLLLRMEILIAASGNAAAGTAQADREERLTGPDPPNLIVYVHPAHERQEPKIDAVLHMGDGLLLGHMTGHAVRLLSRSGADMYAADRLIIALAVEGGPAGAPVGNDAVGGAVDDRRDHGQRQRKGLAPINVDDRGQGCNVTIEHIVGLRIRLLRAVVGGTVSFPQARDPLCPEGISVLWLSAEPGVLVLLGFGDALGIGIFIEVEPLCHS